MSSAATFDTIEQYLRAQWTTTPLVFENEPYELPGNPAHFVFVEIFGDVFDQASIGADPREDNLWREAGQLYLHVMTQNDIGSRLARQYADQLVDLLKGQDIGAVTFFGASKGAGEPGMKKANYWAFTATIDWQRDE
ncbi:hypothetical protein [Mesorhizobium sp. YM1C-6-2]|uniref:hypothetical protein n=1 Tax=Mesorhizobium sp. YM1C-6-2 TaxID=1827501 RepID=UPI000EF25107|nr:hypothetical protein [Mesorhizobium sp. YM1C-6-2]RLP22265.1 hypothetical protein D8676_25330 [Mesorhizobium sp. YM1C-6-2]